MMDKLGKHDGAIDGAHCDSPSENPAGAHVTGLEHLQSGHPVGYGRPPRETRFRPGQSGNPGGRPKGARNLSSIIAATLGERVAINENGKRRRISKMEAMVKQLVNRAASGDVKATQLLLSLVQTKEAEDRAATAQSAMDSISDNDAFVMADLARRMGEAER